jgi:hypothetical protein
MAHVEKIGSIYSESIRIALDKEEALELISKLAEQLRGYLEVENAEFSFADGFVSIFVREE